MTVTLAALTSVEPLRSSVMSRLVTSMEMPVLMLMVSPFGRMRVPPAGMEESARIMSASVAPEASWIVVVIVTPTDVKDYFADHFWCAGWEPRQSLVVLRSGVWARWLYTPRIAIF